MSHEYREWSPSLEKTESDERHETIDSVASPEVLERARNILEQFSQEPEQTETFPAEQKRAFRELPPVILAKGLTLERMERPNEQKEIYEQISPAEYTSSAYMDVHGISHHGQVDAEKLTPVVLRNISNSPEKDIPLWTRQSEANSCAVNCAAFVLRSEVDPTLTEAKLIEEGLALKLYTPHGTYFQDVGALCEVYGMSRMLESGASLEDIEQVHDGGGKVMAMVSAGKLAYPGLFGFFRADHVVQVVGIDRNDPDHMRVILNDPGRPDGQGLSVPADVFLKAWDASGRSMASLFTEVKRT